MGSASSSGAGPPAKGAGGGKDAEADVPLKKLGDGWRYNAHPSWLKRLLFLDVDPLVNLGYRTRLEPEHMCEEPTVQTSRLIGNLEPAWQEQLKKPKPDLKRALLRGNGHAFIYTGVLYLFAQACSLAGPLLLRRIVGGLQCHAAEAKVQVKAPNADLGCQPFNELYYYIIGLFLAPVIQSLCENQQMFVLYLVGTRMRNALMARIYRKCLRLSNSSMQAESAGRVVTLMSNDAQKLQDAATAIHALWGSPVYIIAVLVLLWFEVGWATFVGLGVMLALVPLTGILAAKLGGLRREVLQWTDKRVGRMSELINGIQMIKFYAWESSFREEVAKCRAQEARILKTTAAWSGAFAMLLFAGPVAVAIFCFGSYTLAGNELSTAKAYTALALFSLLRFPMSFLPMLITMVVNALVAIKRISGFLRREEAAMDEWDPSKVAAGTVVVKDGVFSWDEKAEKPIMALSDINLQASSGTLTMVVGGVGSGKSSLLSALVGAIGRVSGEVLVGGRIAYVAQTAWVMNDTLQENVLCGAPLDPERYHSALMAAQLGPDLEILPNGDLTEIGDRGITLSGGQKQRVSIARAIYYDADVYIMDDPLSAVDSHVGKALFDQVIRGVLRSKTVLLVTNALQYLPHADTIVWLEGGATKAQGSYQQLLDAGLNISELAHDEAQEAEDVEDAKAATGAAAAAAGGVDAHAKPVKAGAGGKKGAAHVSFVGGEHGPAASSKLAGAGKISLTRQATDTNRNLTGIESREAGAISGGVVGSYVAAGGGLAIIITLFWMFATEQGARVYTDLWVGNWFGDKFNQSTWFYLAIYAGLGCFYAMLTFVRSITFMFTCVRATLNLHNQLLDHLLLLPKSFFDTNPTGRVLNRFSRDVDIMDSTLPGSLIQFAGCVATYVAILIVITIATKWFGVALVPLTIIYFTIQRYYIPAARELQRIESITRSPIYSRFGEAMQGAATIRAYRLGDHFTTASDVLMERNAYAFITQKLAAGWLAMRLDMLGMFVLTLAGALAIQGNIDPGMAGLALVYALDLTRFLKHGTAMASKSEADFNSVERIVQYLQPGTEAAPETDPQVAKELGVDEHWPSAGAIEVVDLSMRYRPEMPLVLRGVSFKVAGGEKVGLVGRTGSGKSSILLALFRMVEAESGVIRIDGVDISRLGLRHLRSKMSIIPQDPFMFSGTVRHNLDPFATHADEELWEVITAVGLKPAISALEDKLGAKVVDNGANFSLGQRQLFCLARAMLRKSRVLMLDEATASVDVDTDAAIQGAIRVQFGDVTCLTIAHRLNTIMDADRVVVLEAGRVVEDDEPAKLLDKVAGLFTGMVDQTGKSSARFLKQLARTASVARSEMALLPSGASYVGSRSAAVYQRTQSVFNTSASFANRKQAAPGSFYGTGSSILGVGSGYGAASPSASATPVPTPGPSRVPTTNDIQALAAAHGVASDADHASGTTEPASPSARPGSGSSIEAAVPGKAGLGEVTSASAVAPAALAAGLANVAVIDMGDSTSVGGSSSSNVVGASGTCDSDAEARSAASVSGAAAVPPLAVDEDAAAGPPAAGKQ